MLEIAVTDRGPGFDQAILAQIGKPYQTTKHRPGAGLGLFLAVNVARSLGGSIEIGSRRGGGALVRMILPLATIAIDYGALDDDVSGDLDDEFDRSFRNRARAADDGTAAADRRR